MTLGKNLWLSLALAPVLASFLALPVTGRAAEHPKHMKCEVTKDGKTETKEVKSKDDCTKMGGKLITEHKKK